MYKKELKKYEKNITKLSNMIDNIKERIERNLNFFDKSNWIKYMNNIVEEIEKILKDITNNDIDYDSRY